ncbi:hypothetical protein [Sphingopyxis sp. PET50]|uniref:hypothetical protein n=1 Tax=Sphingopyxis sp. PET50 TaxID=2976533 RepID=UPI0021B00991|nr:hypothetical protein [Sphingopyxis sp. PET50]
MTGLFLLVATGTFVLIFAVPRLSRRVHRRTIDVAPAGSGTPDYSDIVGDDKGFRLEKPHGVIHDAIPHDKAGPPPSVG